MRLSNFNIEVLAAASAVLMVCGTAAGQTIIPIGQSRLVSNERVNAPQCSNDFLFDGEEAEGFEPFEAFVETQQGCDSGFASATADQQSQIDSASMTASGAAMSEAQGPLPGLVHAFGHSSFEVTFELAASSRFTLDGSMSAASFPDANVGTIVLARLWEGRVGGVLLFEQSIEPPSGGGTNNMALETDGALEPGVYTLDVQAGSFMDNDVPPSRLGEASFNFAFHVTILGDLNGDGEVGPADLAILLGNWGPCINCDFCPADLNDDCVVGPADLAVLLGNWG